MDGKNYVKRIASISRVKTDLVKACIQNLVYYRVVQCLDGIFMYSNEFMVTPEIRLFRENKDFRKEFYRFLYYLDDDDQPELASCQCPATSSAPRQPASHPANGRRPGRF